MDTNTATTVPTYDTNITHHSDAPTCTLSLTRARMLAGLKSAAPFVCLDQTRFHLNGVLIERANNGTSLASLRFVATDGHTLARADVPTTDITDAPKWPEQMLVASESVADAIKLLKHRKADAGIPVTLEVRKRNGYALPAVTLVVDGARLALKLIDAQFPPYQQVIPHLDARNGQPSIGLNPRYVARACDAIVAFAGHESDVNARGTRFTSTGSKLDPVRLDFESPDCGEFVAVIMPMRMD